MSRRVFVHIGVPKTGTTFLQTAMWHNRRLLREQDLLYPGRERMDHYHASRVVRGVPPERLGDKADSWDRLVSALEAWEGDGLVSHEFFCMATAAQAHDAVQALRPAEVHIVLTARDYVRQFPAVWQEALKMNSDQTFGEFMQAVLRHERAGAWSWTSQDLPAILDTWAPAVGPQRVHVVTVPPAGAPRDLLWRRWCEALEVDDSAFDLDVGYRNESLGAAQAALLLRLRPYLSGPLTEGPVRHRWLRQYLGHEVLVPQRGERFGPRPDEAAALGAVAREAVETIAAGGYDVVGDLQDLIPQESPASSAHPDDVTETELVEVSARAIEQMIRDVRDVTNERNELRRQAEELARRRPTAVARRLVRRTRRRVWQ